MFYLGTESQLVPTLPQLPSGTQDDQGEWKINTSALRRAFPNFSQSGSSDEESIELGRGHKRGIDATLKSFQSDDPSASMSLTFPATGDRWKVKSTPPFKARKSQVAEQGDLRTRNNLRHASQKENIDPLAELADYKSVGNLGHDTKQTRRTLAEMRAIADSDDSAELHKVRPAPMNITVRENRWNKKQPLEATDLNTPKRSGLQQALRGATVDTTGSAQPATIQSFILPDIPNITELVSGVRRDGTPLFSRSAKPKSRFATPSMTNAQNARPSYSGVNQVPIPADEKALYASLQLLQEKVAGLELDNEQLEKRAEDYELEVLQLRSKLEEADDNNNQHSDSGVGYDEEETKTKEWEQEKSQFAVSIKTLQKRLDRANKKLANSEMTIKTLQHDRDAAHVQLMQAHLGSEELKTETQAVSEEISKAKRHIDKVNRQWEKRLQKLTQQETELRAKISRREKAINEMASLAKDLWSTRNAMSAVEAVRGREQSRRKSVDRQSATARSRSRRQQDLDDGASDAESTVDITPNAHRRKPSGNLEQDADYMSFMDGDEIAKLRQVVEEDRAILARTGIQLDRAAPQAFATSALPRKSSLKQMNREQPNDTTRDISVQFDHNDNPPTDNITDIQQTTQQSINSHHSHASRRSMGMANDDLTSAIILPDITLADAAFNHQTRTVPRPTPVSDRDLPRNEDHTLRPAQDPSIALASVLKNLEDEVAQLRIQLSRQQSLYQQHDPALTKRKRKAVFDRMQKLLTAIELRSDQIYALYDVLEGQKASNQLMDENVVEVTLRNVGIDPDQALRATTGNKAAGIRGGAGAKASRVSKSGMMSDAENDTEDDEDLPWEGFDTTHSLASFRV